jgi:hypothetical protein
MDATVALAASGTGLHERSDGKRFRTRRNAWFLVLWALLSTLWVGGVAIELYNRATLQADMSRDIEQELDSNACVGPKCATPRITASQHWKEIAQTYLQFGYVRILEWAALPPLAMLLIGCGGCVLLRRRHETREA